MSRSRSSQPKLEWNDWGGCERRRPRFSHPRLWSDWGAPVPTPPKKTEGEIFFRLNEVLWKIPHFYTLINNYPDPITIYSPEYELGKSRWQLHVQINGSKNPETGKNPLEIGVEPKSDCCNINMLKVCLGIIGKNIKISCFETISGFSSLNLLDISELDNKKDQWVPEGYLSVFFSIKVENENNTEETSLVTARKMGFRKLQEDLKDIMQNGNLSDVILKVDDKEFKSHRCILAARSPVFLAMMMHDTKEKATGVVELKDIDPDTFSHFFGYLYNGCLADIASVKAQKLYIAADMYQMYELKKLCVEHMLKDISVDNFCDLYALSLLHKEQDLADACSEFFIKNPLDIVKTSQWQVFLSENLVAGNELFMKQLQANK